MFITEVDVTSFGSLIPQEPLEKYVQTSLRIFHLSNGGWGIYPWAPILDHYLRVAPRSFQSPCISQLHVPWVKYTSDDLGEEIKTCLVHG